MALFGSSKRNVFQPTPYGSSRRKRRIPRWLVLILTGIVLGSGGVLFLQKSYGPTRLTAEQSLQLQSDLNSANLDKQRLQAQVDSQSNNLGESKSAQAKLATQLKQSQEQIAKLKNDLELFAQSIPPDPRGTNPGIRATDFNVVDDQLNYKILVMQDKEDAAPFQGDMELRIAGYYPNGNGATINTEPEAITVGYYNQLQGTATLPRAFTPRTVTVMINQRDSKKLAATRTLRVGR